MAYPQQRPDGKIHNPDKKPDWSVDEPEAYDDELPIVPDDKPIKRRVVYVYGPPGCGKSTYIRDALANMGTDINSISHWIGSNPPYRTISTQNPYRRKMTREEFEELPRTLLLELDMNYDPYTSQDPNRPNLKELELLVRNKTLVYYDGLYTRQVWPIEIHTIFISAYAPPEQLFGGKAGGLFGYDKILKGITHVVKPENPQNTIYY